LKKMAQVEPIDDLTDLFRFTKHLWLSVERNVL
jgi:hypothetical protein